MYHVYYWMFSPMLKYEFAAESAMQEGNKYTDCGVRLKEQLGFGFTLLKGASMFDYMRNCII